MSLCAQQTQTEITREEQVEDIYQVSLRTSEARKSIRFAQSRDGRIVIEAVAIGSEAEEVHRPNSQAKVQKICVLSFVVNSRV